MKNTLKVVSVIIGTVIGAGFASRKRNTFIFHKIWNKWNNRNNNILFINRTNNIQSNKNIFTKKHRKL